ncbi:MAG: hypothetical protein K2F94_01655, partial [Muribaculaceae bacterium]|nr:hypothetical protein [Muribaculaceae bacterium]
MSWLAALPLTAFPKDPQRQESDSVRFLAESRVTFSAGSHTPLWLVSNIQGLGSIKKNNGFVRAALFKDIDS